MDIKTDKLKIIEDKSDCLAYDCEGVYYIALKAGAVASDHMHEEPETIYLVSGTAEVSIGEKIHNFTGPMKVTLPGGVHHKITAITDCIALERR